MSGSLGQLNIQLSLEQAQFNRGLNSASRSVKQFANLTNNQLSNIEKSVAGLSKAFTLNTVNILYNQLANFGPKIIKGVDSYTELSNRIKLVTSDSTEQAAAMQAVFDISTRTSQSLAATGQVYTKLTNSGKQLGLAQKEIADLTETVNKNIALSGVSAASAEAGLLQFSQALDKGVLNGQELTSVMTQTPALAQAIADGLGVPIGALKEMGEKGELSADQVILALRKVKDKIDVDYSNTTVTVSNALESLPTMNKIV